MVDKFSCLCHFMLFKYLWLFYMILQNRINFLKICFKKSFADFLLNLIEKNRKYRNKKYLNLLFAVKWYPNIYLKLYYIHEMPDRISRAAIKFVWIDDIWRVDYIIVGYRCGSLYNFYVLSFFFCSFSTIYHDGKMITNTKVIAIGHIHYVYTVYKYKQNGYDKGPRISKVLIFKLWTHYIIIFIIWFYLTTKIRKKKKI